MNRFFNTRTIIIIFVVLAGTSIISSINSGSNGIILRLLYTIPAVLIALTFHEWGHAFVAYKLGDNTAKEQGRVTLNPLKHLDPLRHNFSIDSRIWMGKTSANRS